MFKKAREIKQIIEQGFKDSDLWSLDYFFSDKFSKMLFKFAQNQVGSPQTVSFDDIKDYPIEFIECSLFIIKENIKDNKNFSSYSSDDIDEVLDLHNSYVIWQMIILRMAYCFRMTNEEFYDNEYSDEYFKQVFGENGWQFEDIGNGYHKLVFHEAEKDIDEKYHKREKEIEDTRMAMKNEALELLSKWYFDLWD